jgi:ABC-type transport system substrate-binding protein
MIASRTLRRPIAITGSALALALGATGGTTHSPLAGTGGAGVDDRVHVVQAGSDTPSGVYLSRRRAVVHLDPQRDDDPEVQAFARIFLQRSLTSLNYATPGNVAGVVPDLALSLGRSDRRHVTWRYTLRLGVRFEGGSPVTARDVQYGVSRLYAQELRFPGLDHVQALLAVPGSYPGPYAATPAQQAAFERAVEMSPDGMTLTFHLRRPAPDFDQVAALPAFGPVPPAVTLETATTPGPSPQAPTESPATAVKRSYSFRTLRGRPRPTPYAGGRRQPLSSSYSATQPRLRTDDPLLSTRWPTRPALVLDCGAAARGCAGPGPESTFQSCGACTMPLPTSAGLNPGFKLAVIAEPTSRSVNRCCEK